MLTSRKLFILNIICLHIKLKTEIKNNFFIEYIFFNERLFTIFFIFKNKRQIKN